MVKFTKEQLRSIMDMKHNIRSMSVIAHVDHGKTTLTDALVHKAGIISGRDAGVSCHMHTRPDEAERGITIKSTGISMFFEYDVERGEACLSEEDTGQVNCGAASDGPKTSNSQISKHAYLINLIDSPGHVDFSSEVTAALRVTDGALVVIDSVEGVCAQTEMVLRQAIAERVKPVLMVNKADRAILELQLPPEELYQAFQRSIESVNVVIATYSDEALGDWQVHPTKGTVTFGSGLHQWAFSLRRFGRDYGSKFGVPEDKMIEKLWGDWFYDAGNKMWITKNTKGDLERAFCQFIARPIICLFDSILGGKTKKVEKMLKAINVELKGKDKELSGKALLKRVMQKWLPASDAVLEMIILHLPSPAKAQAYRVDTLYDGPLDDKTAMAIRTCDTSPGAPMCMYVSKMVPTSDKGRFYAFGRVFSGTIAAGQKVRIMGANYVHGKNSELWVKNVQRIVIMMGRYTESVASVPAGNTCALVGVDQYLLKSGTIATEEDACPIVSMRFSVSPVVRCAVQPKHPADLPDLVEGMKRLAKSDPMVLCYTEESGEHIVAACGELHLEICLNDLQNEFMNGAECVISDPVVSFRETCLGTSSATCLAKSTNKLNRLFVAAEPLGLELCKAIDDGYITADADAKTQSRRLVDEFGWDVSAARKIWAFGPNGTGPNMFVDTTKGVNNVLQARDSVVGGFTWATQSGPICGEPMHGCRFNLMDIVLHSDAVHRGTGQVLPAARRVCFSSMMMADPGLLEPIYLCNISVTQEALGNVYSVLTRRRGQVFAEERAYSTPQMTLSAYLPVMESFGFTTELRLNTGGKAFPQFTFDHWQPLSGSPFESGTKAEEVVLAVRRRKGLLEGIPGMTKYLDKL